MTSADLNELSLCLEEMEKILATAQHERVKDLIKTNISTLKSEMCMLQRPVQTAISSIPPTIPRVSTRQYYNVKLTNYAWDESDKLVKIYVTLKNIHTLKEPCILCKFTPRSVELSVYELEDRNYFLVINNLVEDIDKQKSYWRVKTDKVAIFLVKSNPGSRWTCVTLAEKKAKEPKLPKVDTDESTDPTVSLVNMMKQMYEDGDDEVKRTIAKAWTETREKQSKDSVN